MKLSFLDSGKVWALFSSLSGRHKNQGQDWGKAFGLWEGWVSGLLAVILASIFLK